ncbi:MAG: hypothetical protein FWG73_09465 [Planctomycetaceae bacterium]|nr:hypothetical protein [Planctomycetaceae bacterium]
MPTLFNPFLTALAMKVQELTFPSTASRAAGEFGTMQQDIKVIALIKGTEQYVFLYNDDNRAETLRLLGRYASNPELSFTWYDAAVLSQKIRQESLQQARESQLSDLPPSGISLPVDKLF